MNLPLREAQDSLRMSAFAARRVAQPVAPPRESAAFAAFDPANVPGARELYPVEYRDGMPGVRVGQ